MPDTISAQDYRTAHGASEREIQRAVCQYLDALGVTYYAVPNGQYRPGQAKEAGMQKGVPDLCIPVPRGGYGALYIEMKKPGRYTRKSQRAWLDRLREEGNACAVCRSVDEVQYIWEEYRRETLGERDLWPDQR